MQQQPPTRRLYAIGACAVPESTPAGAPNPARRYPLLKAMWQMAEGSGRLGYCPNVTAFNAGTAEATAHGVAPSPSSDPKQAAGTLSRKVYPFGGPPGVCRGLYAAKFVVCGTAIEAMDPAFVHVDSLDVCFRQSTGPGAISIVKVTGSGPVSLALLNIGVLITLSGNPDLHGSAIGVPGPNGEPTTATIVDVAAGESHYAYCDSKGRVFTWGWGNDYGQLGRGNAWPSNRELIGVHEPLPLIGFGGHESAALQTRENDRAAVESPRVVAVACGRHHTLLLTEARNCVYAFGRGHRGQLGFGRKGATPSTLRVVDIAPSPRSVPLVFGCDITAIHAPNDGDTSIVQLRNGHVIVFGDNTSGQCGTGDTKAVTTPRVVTAVAKHIDIENDLSAAESGSASKTRTRTRSPRYGTVESFLNPRRVPNLAGDVDKAEQLAHGNVLRVVDVACTSTHTFVSAVDGTVLSCGLRPLRTLGEKDPIGVLGRMLGTDEDALSFGAISGIHFEPEDRLVCGLGFMAILNRRRNDIHLIGRVTGPNGSISSNSTVQQHAISLSAPVVAPALLDLGIDKRVVDIYPSGRGGLLLLVDCFHARK